MNLNSLWQFICICLTAVILSEAKNKRYGEGIDKIEIGLDLVEGNALITYNDEWKTTAKISYEEKKKIVAYRDDESGHCLLEKITKRKNGDGRLSSRVYHFSETFSDKVKAEKSVGKKLVSFCSKYPITFLKEFSDKKQKRSKRETDLIRGVESQLSHQQISKKLLVDLAIAEGLVANGGFSAKGVKRNVDDGRAHHASASAKMEQPAAVDYHAGIRNNLPSGGHPMHPIDITSSVTIATSASHPVWPYPPSSGSHYNTTESGHPGVPHHPPSTYQNTSQSHYHSPEIHGVPSAQSFRTLGYHLPSSRSKPQQNTANYPPSSVSKAQPHYPPSSFSKPHTAGYYPPSSTSKTHVSGHFSPSHLPQPAYYSHSTIKTLHNGTDEGSRPSFGTQFSSSVSSSHVYHQSYIPPSSTGKLHYSPQNSTHSSFHPERGMYAPQFPPSSTSKVYHQQYGSSGRGGAPQYPPSSTSNVHGGSHNHVHGFMQYPPSSTSKLGQAGSLYTQQYHPSSTNKLNYSPSGHTSVLERPSEQDLRSYPPSSTSKVQYSPHSHVISVDGVQYYPPSSSSKTHYSPSSSGHDSSAPHAQSQYPPSSTVKLHYSPAQIPQPPTERNLIANFPPSSTSKLHPHYPPSASSKLPQRVGWQGQHHYPPSSTSKLHQTSSSHQNFSSTKQPGYYPPSSTSKLHHTPIHNQDIQTGGRITATRVSITPGFAYYPPPLSTKPQFVQQGHSTLPDQYPYYGPSSSGQHHNISVPSGHGLHSPQQYPPSSTTKIYSSQQQNESAHHTVHSKPFYPMEHPSSSDHHYPIHHNDSSSGEFSHRGTIYPPSGHRQFYHPQYPPASSSYHPQPGGGTQTQFHHDLPPSSQGSHSIIRPCQSSPRSLYSVTTRTILTPNGVIHRPVSVKNNGEYPCGQLPGPVSYSRYAPCSGTLTRNGQVVRPQAPCTANGNLRKSMRNSVPGLAVAPDGNTHDHNGNEQHHRAYGLANAETQTELVHGHGHHHGSHFSKLQAATPENSTSNKERDDATAPESFEENGKSGKDVEVFEAEDRIVKKPVKYQENEGNKEEVETKSEEEVKEGDILEPGDRILGKDGYAISEGFRGRVVAVTGQIAKKRADTGKDARVTIPQNTEKKSNSGQFKYSSDLGRYVKENGEKNYSNCQGEPTFTCSEFLGSNGRAKICKPNPRRNPDGSPC